MNNGILFFTQRRKHICALMNFGSNNKITEDHMRDAIEAKKLEAVSGGSLFENNFHILNKFITFYCISNSW